MPFVYGKLTLSNFDEYEKFISTVLPRRILKKERGGENSKETTFFHYDHCDIGV